METGSLLGVKRPVRDVDHTHTPSSVDAEYGYS